MNIVRVVLYNILQEGGFLWRSSLLLYSKWLDIRHSLFYFGTGVFSAKWMGRLVSSLRRSMVCVYILTIWIWIERLLLQPLIWQVRDEMQTTLVFRVRYSPISTQLTCVRLTDKWPFYWRGFWRGFPACKVWNKEANHLCSNSCLKLFFYLLVVTFILGVLWACL